MKIDAELFDALTRSAGLAADLAASEKFRDGETIATQVGAGVEAAFAHAIGLGLITVHPTDTWPFLRKIRWGREEVVR